MLVAQQPSKVGYTHHQADGNRIVQGEANIGISKPLDIPLNGPPIWLVGAAFEDGALWVAVQADGTVEAIKTDQNRWNRVPILPKSLPSGMPPILQIQNGHPNLIHPKAEASQFSHAIGLDNSDRIAFLTIDGDLVIEGSNSTLTLPINALPDARLITDGGTRLAVLTKPTSRYQHGVLGDAIEAAGITLITTTPSPQIIRTIEIPSPWVIEGIAPIWMDLNGDSERELIVTLSSHTDGGKIVVYHEDGTIAAEGPGIGRGFRWRNQMAVARYGPNGEIELSAVKTPHIGGTVEFFRWTENRLDLVASIPGFTSHVIRSRNLDLNVSGRFLGTPHPIVLLPNNRRTVLNGIQHTEEGASVVLDLPIGAQLSSNPASVPLAGGLLAVAIGRNDGMLRVWSPKVEAPQLSIQVWTLGQLEPELDLSGKASRSYWIEESHDLATWERTKLISLSETETHQKISVPFDQENTQRFFRAIQAPTASNTAE